MKPFLDVRRKRENSHQARFHPLSQTRFEPLVSVVPFICIMSCAGEIRLFPCEQDIQALVQVFDVVFAGRGNDDVGFGYIQSVYFVVDVFWEGGGELESFEKVGHAPSWVFEEEAQMDVNLGAEGVD